MGRQAGGSCINLHVMPGLVGGLDSGRTQRSWEGRERETSLLGSSGTWPSFDCEGSRGGSSTSQVLYSWGFLSWGCQRTQLHHPVFWAEGDSPRHGEASGGCLLGLPQAFSSEWFVLWNLCVGVVSMATRHLRLVVLMVMLLAARSAFSGLHPLG